MIIGQIVHDIIGPTGVKTSTKEERGLGTIITNKTDSDYENHKVKLTTNLVDKVNKGSFSRIGIQAPAGTVAVINGKDIQIGRTEVYELNDNDIPIISLTFSSEIVNNLIIDYAIL